MSKASDPTCRRCRREGEKLFLLGEKCSGPKCPVARRTYPPGQHGMNRRTRLSEYGTQLREKQKAKAIYGVLEKQFENYYKESTRGKDNKSILALIERRLDNVVYRLGFAPSRRAARQLVSHNHMLLNGKKMNIPSYQVKIGDIISFKDSKSVFVESIEGNKKNIRPCSWLKHDSSKTSAEVTSFPTKEDIGEEVQERLIIEYYSR